jgi:hypothetical protein
MKIRKSCADGSLVVRTSWRGFVASCDCWKENSDEMRSDIFLKAEKFHAAHLCHHQTSDIIPSPATMDKKIYLSP